MPKRAQSVGCRLFAQVDFRREMRSIAFVDLRRFPLLIRPDLPEADFLDILRGGGRAGQLLRELSVSLPREGRFGS